MPLSVPSWLSEGRNRDLFMQFPLALAIAASAEAKPVPNARFQELLDPACLEGDVLRGMVRSPGAEWHRVWLPGRNGESLEARAQALAMNGNIMLVVDDTPESVSGGEVDELRRRVSELERLSATDALTGAWNRAHMDRVLEAELSRSLRFRQPLSLLVIDIDRFKRINDGHGHPAGDAVLVEMARLLKARVRASDHVFRWGGEEFVVLAPATGYRAAGTLAESLRAAVEAHPFPVVKSVTASAGVAEHRGKESAEDWFARADTCLYAAKNGGRNRVVVDRQGNSDDWLAERGTSALRLAWQEAYECGQPDIDRQHEALFAQGNRVIDASIAGEPARLEAELATLFAALEAHCRDEEAVLARAGYPGLAAHAEAHTGLMARAAELRGLAAADPKLIGPLVEFLAVDVIAKHLFAADREYFPLFAATPEAR